MCSYVFLIWIFVKMLIYISNKNKVSFLSVFVCNLLNENLLKMLIHTHHKNKVSLQYVFTCAFLMKKFVYMRNACAVSDINSMKMQNHTLHRYSKITPYRHLCFYSSCQKFSHSWRSFNLK